jgi:hypothetical protein
LPVDDAGDASVAHEDIPHMEVTVDGADAQLDGRDPLTQLFERSHQRR